MNYINVKGKKYRIIETLPYHSVGLRAKIVEDKMSPTRERVAVFEGGRWRFWTDEDRLGGGSSIIRGW